jgi:uncharacterized protein (TIGR02217 family)
MSADMSADMGFDNVRFPTAISLGATGGPERRTDVVMTASGREERNARWASSRRKYNVGYGLRSLDDIQAVVTFFEERQGRLHAFRFKDHGDFKSCAASSTPAASDQQIRIGDGTTASFQLSKTYGQSERAYARSIHAPVAGSVKIAVNNSPVTSFVLNAQTGMITFNPGHVPAPDTIVTAGFEFDVPVRFDTDDLTINISHFQGGEIPHIPLIEVRP